jgi:sulfoxide reductase heme-binding subunit YedZ
MARPLATLAPRQLQVVKALLFLASLLPFARLVLAAFADRLGANPVEFITRNTGDWTLYFLCFTLAVTPLRRLSGWNWLIRLRRMLGLYAFFYASLHFMTFLWFDHFFDVAAMWKDVLKRPFITVGFACFVLLVPLAATSTNAMIKRLGRNWARLHKLIYVVAPLAILHYWWMKAGKHNFEQPIVWGSVVAVLLLLRVWWSLRRTRVEKTARPASVRS